MTSTDKAERTTRPPRETCPGVPERLLPKADADRVAEARERWFLETSRNA